MGVGVRASAEIVRRMVYAVADPGLSASIMIRQDAVRAGVKRSCGSAVLVDVRMLGGGAGSKEGSRGSAERSCGAIDHRRDRAVSGKRAATRRGGDAIPEGTQCGTP